MKLQKVKVAEFILMWRKQHDREKPKSVMDMKIKVILNLKFGRVTSHDKGNGTCVVHVVFSEAMQQRRYLSVWISTVTTSPKAFFDKVFNVLFKIERATPKLEPMMTESCKLSIKLFDTFICFKHKTFQNACVSMTFMMLSVSKMDSNWCMLVKQ